MAKRFCPPAVHFDDSRDDHPQPHTRANLDRSGQLSPAGNGQLIRASRHGCDATVPSHTIPACPGPRLPLNDPHQNPSQPLVPWSSPARSRRYGVQISDIRNENLTEADARQRLSSYVVIRMTRRDCPNEVDEEGYPQQPTWRLIDAVEETVISQQEATRKARALIRRGPPVADKKSELGPAIQDQIERTKKKLEESEPDFHYHYMLVQLDTKFRLVSPNKDKKSNKCKCGRSKCKCALVEVRCKCTSVRAKCSCSLFRMICKNTQVKIRCTCGLGKTKHAQRSERVSVTGYFMRTPRPGENALAMLQEEQRRMHRSNMPSAPSGAGLPPTSVGRAPTTGPSEQTQPASSSRQLPPPMSMPRPHTVNTRTGGQPRQGTKRVELRSPHGSRNCSSSGDSSEQESSGYSTAGSSSESSSRGSSDNKIRSRSRHISRSRPEYFGLRGSRVHTRADHECLAGVSPLRVPQVPVLNTRTAREPAYVDRDSGLRPEYLHVRAVLSRQPYYEARREVYVDDLGRMRGLHRTNLEDEACYERDSRREQDAHHDWLEHCALGNPFRAVRRGRESGRYTEGPREAELENPFARVRTPQARYR